MIPSGRPHQEVTSMQVREGMSPEVLTIGPDHSLREASRAMAARHVGAAVVHDPDATSWPRSARARTRTPSTCATT